MDSEKFENATSECSLSKLSIPLNGFHDTTSLNVSISQGSLSIPLNGFKVLWAVENITDVGEHLSIPLNGFTPWRLAKHA